MWQEGASDNLDKGCMLLVSSCRLCVESESLVHEPCVVTKVRRRRTSFQDFKHWSGLNGRTSFPYRCLSWFTVNNRGSPLKQNTAVYFCDKRRPCSSYSGWYGFKSGPRDLLPWLRILCLFPASSIRYWDSRLLKISHDCLLPHHSQLSYHSSRLLCRLCRLTGLYSLPAYRFTGLYSLPAYRLTGLYSLPAYRQPWLRFSSDFPSIYQDCTSATSAYFHILTCTIHDLISFGAM
jgi:hypothetical protein